MSTFRVINKFCHICIIYNFFCSIRNCDKFLTAKCTFSFSKLCSSAVTCFSSKIYERFQLRRCKICHMPLHIHLAYISVTRALRLYEAFILRPASIYPGKILSTLFIRTTVRNTTARLHVTNIYEYLCWRENYGPLNKSSEILLLRQNIRNISLTLPLRGLGHARRH